ncbi:hypothetical protein C8R45DRAFT_918227 [Mycena sanguinolenta]|nr:hypothetical protein C8R45DRAFT_918227 [Mycena sanguinolenta]
MNSTPPPSPPSRKRQRSSSMQSNSSNTSIKRSLSSDGPSLNPNPSSDTDAYMAELTADTVHLNPTSGAMYHLLETLGTLVDRTWWKRWKKACTGVVDKEGGVTEEQLGPVDNSPLVDSSGALRPSLTDTIDFELVPQSAWNDLVSWYGEPKHPLPRKVILRGQQKEASVELNPLRMTAMRMVPGATVLSGSAHSISISCAATLLEFNKALADTARLPSTPVNTPFRVWKVNAPPPAGFDSEEFAVDDFSTYECENIGGTDKTLEETGLMHGDAFVVEFKAQSWLVDAPPPSQPPPLESALPAPLFAPGTGFFDRFGGTNTRSSFGNSLTRALSSSSKTQAIEPGTLGLGNMGNTCFMNSALQCLAHEPELAEYFLNGVFVEELNPDNPLGMHGAIAQAFGALLGRIWAPSVSGGSTSYAPREFKTQLQRFAPQFSGYQQHDSQELVAFLLDGLHEDLNRVIKKPYVEKPDWEGGGDVELVRLAQKSWDGYMLRNDSVIVDLFQGQYQSTLVCPECEKVSITFDPFMYLTLPLPIQKKWKHSIYYVPWDVNKPHVKVPVEIGRDASFKDLRQLLGRWMGAPPDNLLTLEIFSQKFYKNLDDSLLCGEMSPNDHIVCYELPCHAQQSRTYKPQPDDPLILPVYLADYRPPPSTTPGARPLYGTSYTSYQSTTPFGHPMIVVLSPEQAADPAAIYAQVVGRLERWANNAKELFSWEPSSGGGGAVVEEIRINGVPPVDSLVEIKLKANGDVVEHTVEVPESEGDITEEKAQIVVEEDDVSMEAVLVDHGEPVCVGPKRDLFQMKVQPNMKDYGTGNSFNKAETLDARIEEVKAGTETSLLRESDLLLCEFDENFKAFYFGDVRSYRSNDDVRWAQWESFVHPEYEESQREAEQKKNKGISLQDCLDEFTKEEQLGEDDLWYCPRCKKHQQATKKFDLWKAPDVLVVHLKRFSNSRTLRDKIDAFVDFPVDGLDLGEMVGERAAAKRLIKAGVPLEEFQLGNLDEPLVYDLFGVDEHMGGLGGGHYRAYALNHANQKWYHFDDSYVTPAKPEDAVNANAYLLFYRRRTAEPLGGKTQAKIEAARLKRREEPPSQPSGATTLTTTLDARDDDLDLPGLTTFASSSMRLGGGSSPSSMHDEPPDLEDPLEMRLEMTLDDDPLVRSGQRFDFPDPSSNKASPASSTEAEGDLDESSWVAGSFTFDATGSPAQWSPIRLQGALDIHSPSDNSSLSDMNPFTDGHAETASTHLKID